MKTILSSVIVAALFMGLVGCGKSEAQKERDAGRQKFKETVAALKVRTEGATYDEFREAELNLKTSFEMNKNYLADVSQNVDRLNPIMEATDYCWKRDIDDGSDSVLVFSKRDLAEIEVLNPSVANKINWNYDEMKPEIENGTDKWLAIFKQLDQDPDFHAMHNVKLGLAQIDELCGQIMSGLN